MIRQEIYLEIEREMLWNILKDHPHYERQGVELKLESIEPANLSKQAITDERVATIVGWLVFGGAPINLRTLGEFACAAGVYVCDLQPVLADCSEFMGGFNDLYSEL